MMESETAYLYKEEDHYDADDNVWRCAPGELKIKTKTWGPTGTTGWKLHSKHATLQELAAAWERIKTGTVTSVEVLPPENTLPAVQVAHTPEAVLSQYNRANSGMLEVLRFGAMLLDIDRSLQLQTPKNKNQHTPKEYTLKGWLADNCPDANYNTAAKYKGLAYMVLSSIKIPAKLPFTLALPTPDGTPHVVIPDNINISRERVEKIQVEVWETVRDKSMRQMTFDFELTNPKPRGGDRKSGKDAPKLTKEQQFELQVKAAGEYWNITLNDMCFQINKTKSHKMLNEAELTQAVTRLRVISDALKDALKKDGE